METQLQNPKGLHARYYIQKIKLMPNPNFSPMAKQSQVINNSDPLIEGLCEVDKGSEYFVLRLDEGGSDIEHIKACRIGVHAYADAIKHHLPELAADLKERYPLLSTQCTHEAMERITSIKGVDYDVCHICGYSKQV